MFNTFWSILLYKVRLGQFLSWNHNESLLFWKLLVVPQVSLRPHALEITAFPSQESSHSHTPGQLLLPFHVSAQASPPLGSPPCLHPVLDSFSPLCLLLWHTPHYPSHFDSGLTLWLSPRDVAPGDKALSFCPPAQSRAQHTIENSWFGMSGLSDGEEGCCLERFMVPREISLLGQAQTCFLPSPGCGVWFSQPHSPQPSLQNSFISTTMPTFHASSIPTRPFSSLLHEQGIFSFSSRSLHMLFLFTRKSVLFSDGKPFFKDF